MYEHKSTWDETTGIATYTIHTTEYNLTFTGTAYCHPDDDSWKNELVGIEIAKRRAWIKVYQHFKNHELRPQLNALKQLYHSMNRSKNFNEKSYENRMLQRQIRMITFDLTTINETIAELRKDLKHYIDKKDEFHRSIENLRVKQNQTTS